MQLIEESLPKLLARHNSLMALAKYLEGDVNDFINFLKNVFLLEKNLEQERDSGNAQCSLIAQILTSEQQLKKVIFTEEWQHAQEYFLFRNNAANLLDIFYQLELGNQDCSGLPSQLRQKLIREAFFITHADFIEYGQTKVKFVFTPDKPSWTLVNIEWNVREYQGMPQVFGTPVISLGFPNPDGPEIYRHLFAFTGTEKKAAATLGIHGLLTENQGLQNIAKEILQKLDLNLSEMRIWFASCPSPLQEGFEQWAKVDILEREFSSTWLQFLTDSLSFFEKNSFTWFQQLKARMENFGLVLGEMEKPNGYDFSNDVPKGNIMRTRPLIKYYWPENDTWMPIFPGKCSFSAGPVPMFLQELERLTKDGLLQPRPEDLEIVKDLLLYIHLGDKVPKPPILPVYNALRRWFESLGQKQDSKTIETLCIYAKIFRPQIIIPMVGEKPTTIANREHKLIPKLAPEYKPGTIVGIKQAGIVIPGDRMPLCLPGVYWIASFDMASQSVTDATTTIPVGNPEQFNEAWQQLKESKNSQELLAVVRKLLQDMSSLSDLTWETICDTITDFNSRNAPKIIFLPNRQITASQFKELEVSGKFRFKIAHTNRWEEGWVLAQEPGLEMCILVVASGIPSKLLQSIQKLHIWAKTQHYQGPLEPLDMMRCNFVSFLKEKTQRKSLEQLLKFYDENPSDSQKSKEDRELLKAWLDKD